MLFFIFCSTAVLQNMKINMENPRLCHRKYITQRRMALKHICMPFRFITGATWHVVAKETFWAGDIFWRKINRGWLIQCRVGPTKQELRIESERERANEDHSSKSGLTSAYWYCKHVPPQQLWSPGCRAKLWRHLSRWCGWTDCLLGATTPWISETTFLWKKLFSATNIDVRVWCVHFK